ncbi:37S ribosomal protein S16, mitochondrial [Tilletia horrida]|uniref:37S ribosomal protein S16, mitochondrial n=1 Tax=Tilletia horrida TaxID=155126 RepID=A0AAN6GKY0_9BASI|nr:37S ribosomal protein S16, mitochondrial [Tilletia horrida]KAK0548166.1 37S ribosomal protein S16, mitochondrial [Tilletia horrida]KAK0562723.1 37S ribosomal protein S16, mitochondrial [Tilletia horrida]
MVVRLRLARHGTRNNPFYHIVAIHNKKRRNALPIEKLGEYDPIPRLRPAPTPTSAAGPSRQPPKPEGSASMTDVPKPSSINQLSAVLEQERNRSASIPKKELADTPRPGYGLLMTSGLHNNLRLEKRIEWNEDRIRYWLKVGAQPSKPVAKLLDRAGLIPPGKWFKGMPPLDQHKSIRPNPSEEAAKASPPPSADAAATPETPAAPSS